MRAERVGAIIEALRHGDDPSLRRRRRMATMSAIGMADFAVLSLYQLGVIRRLPELPGAMFDSNRINASRSAFPLGVPDATLGAAMYAAILVLAGAGGTRRTGRPALLSYALGSTVLIGAVSAAKYLTEMLWVQRRVCPYCVAGAAINFALLAEAVPEVTATRKRRAEG